MRRPSCVIASRTCSNSGYNQCDQEWAMARAHIVIPDDLLREIDKVAGARGRSRFIVDAVRERIDQIAFQRALRRATGIAKARDYPHWKDRETAAEWVRSIRREKKPHR